MKKFNPDVELKRKKRKYTKKHLVFSLLGLIALTILGISFAYYEVNENSVLVDSNVVAPINVRIMNGEEELNEIPDNYVYSHTTCENNSTATWNEATRKVEINFTQNDDCIIYLNKIYKEEILAGSDPVLDSKMVPVVISDTGEVSVADLELEWYNYTNSEWANAVILNTYRETTPGEVLDMADIAQMYVWIPRYEYSKSSIESAAHAIDVTFVPKSKVNTDIENNDVIVHPAFTFGTDELSGLWVGKFELGWQEDFVDTEDNNDIDTTYIIKPNLNSVHSTNVSTMFYNIQRTKTTYVLDSTTDVHMMKNTEWGLTAYLSQSKYGICNNDGTCIDSEGNNIKIKNNNYFNSYTNDIVTGCGIVEDASISSNTGIAICPVTNRWETDYGSDASTTHNITGIYDMAGGRWEVVMGNMEDINGDFNPSFGGTFDEIEQKYYNLYKNGNEPNDYTRGLWGDATKELKPIINLDMENWNNNSAHFVYSYYIWFGRGGKSDYGDNAGIWSFGCYYNTVYEFIYSDSSSRAVLAVMK